MREEGMVIRGDPIETKSKRHFDSFSSKEDEEKREIQIKRIVLGTISSYDLSFSAKLFHGQLISGISGVRERERETYRREREIP